MPSLERMKGPRRVGALGLLPSDGLLHTLQSCWTWELRCHSYICRTIHREEKCKRKFARVKTEGSGCEEGGVRTEKTRNVCVCLYVCVCLCACVCVCD